MTGTTGRQGPSRLFLAIVSAFGVLLTVGAIALQAGLGRKGKEGAADCHCIAEDTAGDAEPSSSYEQLVAQNAELKRALAAALSRGDRGDAGAACQPGPLAAQPPPAQTRNVPPTPPSPEETLAQEKADLVSLQDQVKQEPVDPVWAPRTEQAAARAIAATESMHLEEVTCRETLCRVRVTHRDLAAREHDVETLLGISEEGGQARVYAPADERTTVMYFTRKGNELSVLKPPRPMIPLPPLGTDEPGRAPARESAN